MPNCWLHSLCAVTDVRALHFPIAHHFLGCCRRELTTWVVVLVREKRRKQSWTELDRNFNEVSAASSILIASVMKPSTLFKLKSPFEDFLVTRVTNTNGTHREGHLHAQPRVLRRFCLKSNSQVRELRRQSTGLILFHWLLVF